MKAISSIQIACILGLLSVGIGAFGAHGLSEILESLGRTETFETAIKYQFYHSLAILAVGIIQLKFPNNRILGWANSIFLAGILIFSGSLLVLSLSGANWLGAITPFGGIALMTGWLLVFLGINKEKKHFNP
ncbi:DUF423 domain-containing protein [Pararhodonellum marinum]|uniref:DUF423 domain-containing protein n=1 Tax=Pararhodonellum marinum TaxID=2755358 RepID=UPI00188F2D04|nr:DUF423 domain-containing protein [Pararhodonellum marinum]